VRRHCHGQARLALPVCQAGVLRLTPFIYCLIPHRKKPNSRPSRQFTTKVQTMTPVSLHPKGARGARLYQSIRPGRKTEKCKGTTTSHAYAVSPLPQLKKARSHETAVSENMNTTHLRTIRVPATGRGRSLRFAGRGSGVTLSAFSGRRSRTVLGFSDAGCDGIGRSPESRHAASLSAIDSLALSISEDMVTVYTIHQLYACPGTDACFSKPRVSYQGDSKPGRRDVSYASAAGGTPLSPRQRQSSRRAKYRSIWCRRMPNRQPIALFTRKVHRMRPAKPSCGSTLDPTIFQDTHPGRKTDMDSGPTT
jgi:hypothetical protein